jgi:GNAT superfamily N-acetyltransferase
MSGENVIGYTSAIIQKKETILDLIVVHEKYRNLGIGERLFKVRLDTLNGNRHFRINHWIREISPKPFCAEKYGF